MKKGISRTKRFLLMAISLILLVTTFVSTLMFVEFSTMRIGYKDGYEYYFMPFYSSKNVPFENTELFDKLCKSDIERITRMCVIKNQMETMGEYDGTKWVDISGFASRNDLANRDSVTAIYTLDDLIKWGNKGFDYKTVDAAAVPFPVLTPNVNMLVNRYKTVDGFDLAYYAKDYDEYQILVKNLISTATSLFENYKEYNKYEGAYTEGKTNLYFCYQMICDGKLVRYTNCKDINYDMSTDDITQMIAKQSKYLYFNPDKMGIKTNTNVSAMDMVGILDPYDYAFVDNSRIWVYLDTNYSADDAIAMARNSYISTTNSMDAVISLVVALTSLLLFVTVLIVLTKKEGRPLIQKITVTNDDGNEEEREVYQYAEHKSDSCPLEVLMIITIAFVCGFSVVGFGTCVYIFRHLYSGGLNYVMLIALASCIDITFLAIWLLYVRKIKAGRLLKDSLIGLLINKIKNSSLEAYDKSGVFFRTWIPFTIILLVNLILFLLGGIGLAVAVFIDLCIGTVIYKNNNERQTILMGIRKISDGKLNVKVEEENMHGDNKELAIAVNNIGDGIRIAVEKSMKDEKMKADLITNVSHDIKTPLTSIINYVDLLKRENIEDEKIKGYIDILDQKSQRLKQLTDDLVEASKISSGNLILKHEKINFVEFMNQTLGEFNDKFDEHGLKAVMNAPESSVYINADAKSLFRVIENLYNNIYKYALHNTRVYIDMNDDGERATLSIKNISQEELTMSSEELLERFKQGDESRKTEGSGLGLSIAKNLTEAMDGTFELLLDGDLFKVILSFERIN